MEEPVEDPQYAPSRVDGFDGGRCDPRIDAGRGATFAQDAQRGAIVGPRTSRGRTWPDSTRDPAPFRAAGAPAGDLKRPSRRADGEEKPPCERHSSSSQPSPC